jgi:hypothetical protein
MSEPSLSPEPWAATYLRGLELFNSQHYWDAHEQWEQLWLAAGRSGPLADFLKGLIKLAAAGVKHLAGQPAGTHSHAVRAAELFRSVAPALGDSYLGLSLPPLIALAETIAEEGWPTQAPVLSLANGAGPPEPATTVAS